MTREARKRIAESLSLVSVQADVRRLKGEIERKSQGEKAARTVILRAIETWTGHGLDEVGGLPIVRDGHFLGYDSGLAAMLTDPIQTVTFGIWTEDSSALRARLKEYKRLRNSLIQVQSLLTNMDLAARLRIRRASHPESGSLQEKIINSLGSRPIDLV